MKPCFVLLKGVHNETQGNLLLHNILGSEVEIVGIDDPAQLSQEYLDERIEATADRLRSAGYKPLVMKHNLPAIDAVIGPAGWLNAADELAQQLKDYGVSSSYIILANGTGETQGALALGLKYLKTEHKVIGISVEANTETATTTVIERANAASEHFGLKTRLGPEDVEVTDEYLGEGYGVPTKKGLNAMRLLAQTEGIFIDPVYTGKAMAALIDLIKKGRFKDTDTIVFLHTGGLPALFAYDKEIIQ
jgi:1-aminocyclopropane-1-carboxylate deaminase/D-cysteine desulfhydrase-like pyridoxal-dependent ACC family enzyme